MLCKWLTKSNYCLHYGFYIYVATASNGKDIYSWVLMDVFFILTTSTEHADIFFWQLSFTNCKSRSYSLSLTRSNLPWVSHCTVSTTVERFARGLEGHPATQQQHSSLQHQLQRHLSFCPETRALHHGKIVQLTLASLNLIHSSCSLPCVCVSDIENLTPKPDSTQLPMRRVNVVWKQRLPNCPMSLDKLLCCT